ncbi:MAG: penicillin-binding transpeptidase domain-containing protein [Oscillospiraceae bacterium]|nr:penicillin-binding transpeptidase domain-containing protein [Oscillospiraceae bacterium]
MSKLSRAVRLSVVILLMVTLAFLGVVRLLRIQVVDAGMYSEQIKETYTATQTIQAVRGKIIDSEGRLLNGNEIVHKIILQRAFLPFGSENEIIAELLNVMKKYKCEWFDSLPIRLEQNYKTKSFQFKNVGEDDLDRFKTRLGLNYDATVENCIKALAENYKIDTKKYDEQMIRYIGGVRYEMELRDFSFQNRYVLAEDITMDVIIELKEKSLVLKGVDIVEEPIRIYNDGIAMPHIRGRINSINKEQYESLKDSGYNLNDFIGFYGIEESMESSLKGDNGIRKITRDSSWEIISDEITKPVIAGNNVKLTIDSEFQKTVQEILANHINWISQKKNWQTRRAFTETTAGAIVVLDATNGAVLAMASNPGYDINDYVDILVAENSDEPPFPHQPLLNRCVLQGYRPGSTFKTITATSALINNTITVKDTVFCGGVYNFYPDYPARCTGQHGSINVTRALLKSCNIFFYDVGRRMGIDMTNLSETAKQYGVGTNLNCDIVMTNGRMTTPDVYKDLLGHEMGPGNVIQAAIGQSETLLTPLHLATVAMTIANNGVRYRPHLVDSVTNYDGTETVYQTPVEIIEDWSEGNEEAFKLVQEGMHMLAQENNNLFQYLPSLPAYKTGTPEIEAGKLFNSAVLGYYPYENPKIAFAVVLEGGEYATRAIRNVIDAYFYGHYEPVIDKDGNVTNHWERWANPNMKPIPGRYNN